jgi:hypothetical protein
MSEILPYSENNEVLLQELVLRLAIIPGDPRTRDPKLLIRQIPEDLPFSLPLPEESQVLGTLIYNVTTMEIVLDTPLSSEQVIDFYRAHLHASGWHESDRVPGHEYRGFVPSSRGGTSLYLFQEIDGPFIRIKAQLGKGTLTDVRVIINRPDPLSFLSMKAPKRIFQQPSLGTLSLIPRLVAPIGSRVRGGGGSSSIDTADTSAELGTDLALSVISAHYATQLEQVGWTCTGNGSAGPAAWHTWTFQDEMQDVWLGRFFLLQMPDRLQEYYLYIRIIYANSTHNDWIW